MTKKTKRYFRDLVHDAIFRLDPRHRRLDSIVQYYIPKSGVRSMDSLFSQMRNLYKHREQYDMYWAFAHAEKELDHALKRLISNLYSPLFARLEQKAHRVHVYGIQKESIQLEYNHLLSTIQKKQTAYHRIQYRLRLISAIVLVLDVAASVFFVMLVSYAFHEAKSYVSGFFAIFLLLFFASCVKILLDKFFINPLMIRWGREQYRISIESIKETLAMYEAVGILLDYDLDYEKDGEHIISRFHRHCQYL